MLPYAGHALLARAGRECGIECHHQPVGDQLPVGQRREADTVAFGALAACLVDAGERGRRNQGEAERRSLAVQHAVFHFERDFAERPLIAVEQARHAADAVAVDRHQGRHPEAVGQRQLQRGGLRQHPIGAAAFAGSDRRLELELALAGGADVGSFGEAEQVLAVETRGHGWFGEAAEQGGGQNDRNAIRIRTRLNPRTAGPTRHR